eukprot:TRINITY_DN2028_c0_g1_i3.p1 TRINITY_DN2028_c0_g1~~TRINITY_DN2028_c0_g1_i3.p1  ORF type:complete len:151 (-),score=4.71 TRINITY_DN2028_c0_g1_i3:63-515(-)
MFIYLNIIVMCIASMSLYFILYPYYIWSRLEVLLLTFQLLSHSLVCLINPGTPLPDTLSKEEYEAIKDNVAKYCKKCRVKYRSGKSIIHCVSCDVCIEGHDHHCPWVGKCIGKKNKVPFYMFLGSTMCLFYYTIIASIACLYFLLLFSIG